MAKKRGKMSQPEASGQRVGNDSKQITARSGDPNRGSSGGSWSEGGSGRVAGSSTHTAPCGEIGSRLADWSVCLLSVWFLCGIGSTERDGPVEGMVLSSPSIHGL